MNPVAQNAPVPKSIDVPRELFGIAADEMYAALGDKDSAYNCVFFVGVKTTGIFCRPICSARKPLRKNVTFHAASADALAAGYRPCKRCHPMQVSGRMPDWLAELMAAVEADPSRRWKDPDLREFGVSRLVPRRGLRRITD